MKHIGFFCRLSLIVLLMHSTIRTDDASFLQRRTVERYSGICENCAPDDMQLVRYAIDQTHSRLLLIPSDQTLQDRVFASYRHKRLRIKTEEQAMRLALIAAHTGKPITWKRSERSKRS